MGTGLFRRWDGPGAVLPGNLTSGAAWDRFFRDPEHIGYFRQRAVYATACHDPLGSGGGGFGSRRRLLLHQLRKLRPPVGRWWSGTDARDRRSFAGAQLHTEVGPGARSGC